ncbi:MAG TPA: 3,4-dihydroxy-2-butanone-4-phosphate synthase [Geminicoccus sp.]|uniref:3,4-dihydroxy-2-butanone-4-phosphate synthase n=1 Tax=Geminicoccus sp. TaxID=2024832 RepID=UPI002D080F72|nr:3,4-dihydroxy-2-butanone-4-phosphate synthase [Geminicoccus sp.]HWL67922.1 3,4-dihydroxy-2-butanone-4-phosphate synthase [Geminicoccus sp.]
MSPDDLSSYSDYLASIDEVLEDARNGRMFILVDDEDRENEGDLVIPAQFCDAVAVNFMAKHGRGLICLALQRQRCEELGLPLMAQGNEARISTAFTVSVEARTGVTTGISAADRARTIAVCIDPAADRRDLVAPGHIFPLMAREGGVLVRTGHTEAAVDICRLAGLYPAGVICEIMNDDGTMARLPDLVAFAQLHGLKIGKIADLVSHRLRHDRLVERDVVTSFESRYGGQWRLQVYKSAMDKVEHVALVKGDVRTGEPVLVRMHSVHILEDLLGAGESGRGDQLHRAMEQIGRAGRGVVVLLREPTPNAISERVLVSLGQKAAPPGDLRVYGVGAQILVDLGVQDMILLSNTGRSIIALDGWGLRVVETRAID